MRGQGVGDAPRLGTAADDHAHAFLVRQADGLADVGLAVDLDQQRSASIQHREERLCVEMIQQLVPRRQSAAAGRALERPSFVQCVAQQLPRRGTRAAGTGRGAATNRHRHQGTRPLQDGLARNQADQGTLPEEGCVAGPAGQGDGARHSFRARMTHRLAIAVEGVLHVEGGAQRAGLHGAVHRVVGGRDLRQAQLRRGVEQPGRDGTACGIDDTRAGRYRTVGSDAGDAAVADHDRRVDDRFGGREGVGPGVDDGDRLRRVRGDRKGRRAQDRGERGRHECPRRTACWNGESAHRAVSVRGRPSSKSDDGSVAGPVRS